MNPDQIEAVLLKAYGVRADPATLAYAAKQLAGDAPFPILAGDARTGRAVRQVVVPAAVLAAAQVAAAS